MKTKPFIVYGALLFLFIGCCKEKLPECDSPYVGTWNIVSVDSITSVFPLDPRHNTYKGTPEYSGSIRFNMDSTGLLEDSIYAISGKNRQFLWHENSDSKYHSLRLYFITGESVLLFDSLNTDTVNMFFRDFYLYITYGLNFADLAKLTRKDLRKADGVTIIRYNRSKGGKLYEIPLDETGITIVKYYQKLNPESAYIFPILNEDIHITPEQIKTRIKTAIKKTNSILKDIATELEIEDKVTTYVARHTFATVLYKDGENPGMISEMLGHSNLQTTLTYLKSFDHSAKLTAGKKLL